MRARIPVTSPRAIQLVAVAAALALLANAYFMATAGINFPPYRCSPAWEPPLSSLIAATRVGVAVGLLVAALHDPLHGLSVRHPLFAGMFLVFGSSVALASGARAMGTGIIYFGRSECLELGPPLSYPLGGVMIVIGLALLFAAGIVLFRGLSDHETDD